MRLNTIPMYRLLRDAQDYLERGKYHQVKISLQGALQYLVNYDEAGKKLVEDAIPAEDEIVKNKERHFPMPEPEEEVNP